MLPSLVPLQELTIDWTRMPMYNTVMAVAAGAGLVSLVLLARRAMRTSPLDVDGAALNFGVLGAILTLTGAHMTLTWPLAAYFPFDNIIFGEPSLAFGVLLLAAAFFLWRRSERIEAAANPGIELARAGRPLEVFVVAMGLALVAIAVAGMAYQLFAAPPEEPLTGLFAEYPWVEATFISGLFAVTGVGAILYPWALRSLGRTERPTPVQWIVGVCWLGAGAVWALFGAINFFTHVGLIINTM